MRIRLVVCGEKDRGGRGDGKVLVLSPGKQIEDVGLDFKARDRNLGFPAEKLYLKLQQ